MHLVHPTYKENAHVGWPAGRPAVCEIEQVRQPLRLNVDNFFLQGHSWAGVLAIEYALPHQQHVKGLASRVAHGAYLALLLHDASKLDTSWKQKSVFRPLPTAPTHMSSVGS